MLFLYNIMFFDIVYNLIAFLIMNLELILTNLQSTNEITI